MNEKGPKEKELGCWIFPFLLCHHFKHEWLASTGKTIWVKRNIIVFLGYMYLLECHCLPSVSEASFDQNFNCGLLGRAAVSSLFIYSVVEAAISCSESNWIPTYCVSTGISWLQGISNAIIWPGTVNMHITCISFRSHMCSIVLSDCT